VASFPSDELAERRARRDGRHVRVLGDAAPDAAGARVAAARHEVAVLTARLGQTVAERDRMAGLAGARRDELRATRDREGALRARVRAVESEIAGVRAQLAARAAAEASLRVQATGLHARIHALRAQAAGHAARTAALAAVVDELRATAGDAQADVERHLAARADAEEALAAARVRAGALEEELAGVRTELGSLHAARERTLGAEEGARAARSAEWAALRTSGARLRAAPPDAASPDLAVDLARAAERLRERMPAGPEPAAAQPAPRPPAAVRSPAPPAPPAVDSAVLAPPRAPGPRVGLRRRLRRLIARRA